MYPPHQQGVNVKIDIEDRVVLITGSTRGLGKEMALAFAEAGAKIVISSLKPDACESTVAEIQALGGDALAVPCHIGQWAQVDELVTRAYDHYGRVDVLINNAGMSPVYPSLSDVSEELFDKVIAVNLRGPFRLSVLVGERMVVAGSGAIINISSDASRLPSPGHAPYAAAKAGLNNLTQSLAMAYGPNVRVNCISAGLFATDISKAWDMNKVGPWVQEAVALKRVGEPREIVGTAMWLASDASSYTTGAVIDVHGGLRIGEAFT